jgi:hypothetical protein
MKIDIHHKDTKFFRHLPEPSLLLNKGTSASLLHIGKQLYV